MKKLELGYDDRLVGFWREVVQRSDPNRSLSPAAAKVIVTSVNGGACWLRGLAEDVGLTDKIKKTQIRKRTIEEIRVWFEWLGPLNPEGDIELEADLLRAAGTVLSNNHQKLSKEDKEAGKPAVDFPVVTINPDSTIDAFLNLANQVDLDRQMDKKDTFMAVQLIHAASQVESDSELAQQLSTAALKIYEWLFAKTQWDSEDGAKIKYDASIFMADIKFARVADKIRCAVVEDSGNGVLKDLRAEAASIIIEQCRVFDEVYSKLYAPTPRNRQGNVDNDNQRGQYWSGHLAELFALIAHRYEKVIHIKAQANLPDINHALMNADSPGLISGARNLLNVAYDFIETSYDSMGKPNGEVKIQLKLVSSKPRADSPAWQARGYIPSIEVVAITGPVDDFKAAINIIRRYIQSKSIQPRTSPGKVASVVGSLDAAFRAVRPRTVDLAEGTVVELRSGSSQSATVPRVR